jgi:mannose-1-phosphate guanylyltransferase
MRALLLAAGIGSRLRPITDTIPKCLVPIHGRPLLDYWLDLLLSNDTDRILINTHYLPEQVAQHVGNSKWRDRIDLAYEAELLGTAGTIGANSDYFERMPFLVAHADNLTTFDPQSFRKAHQTRPEHCAMTMLTFRSDDPRSCGILQLDKHKVVQEFHEKVDNPPGDLANAAVYIIEPEVTDYIHGLGRKTVDMSTEVLPHFVGRIYAFENDGYHRDIGNVESLRRAHEEFKGMDR